MANDAGAVCYLQSDKYVISMGLKASVSLSNQHGREGVKKKLFSVVESEVLLEECNIHPAIFFPPPSASPTCNLLTKGTLVTALWVRCIH